MTGNGRPRADTQLKVGLVGTGGVASKYAALYGEYPRSRLVAVHDPFDAAIGTLAAGAGATVARSLEELLDADLDAVVISTPNRLHLGQTVAALSSGRHVLLQKPMTTTVEEADALVDAAGRSGRTLAMYMNSLDSPVHRDIRRMIVEGVLGEVGAVNCKLANGMGHRWRPDTANFWRASRQAVGGGSFAMLACHYINLAQWLIDDEIVRAAAMGKSLMCGHIEGDDIMTAVVEFGRGGLGTIESSWCVRGEQMSVHGSTGSIAYIDSTVATLKGDTAFEGEVIRYREPGSRMVVDGLSAPAMGDWRNPYNQHRRFVDAILDGTPVEVPAEVGLRDMRVIAACYRAAEAGAQVDLRHNEGRAA